MDLTFCAKCKGIMMPSGSGKMKCRKCGHEIAKASSMEVKTAQKQKEIVVIEDDNPNLPTIERPCPECGNERAFYGLVQTRSSDEPPTRFFRCTKCKHTWREYS